MSRYFPYQISPPGPWGKPLQGYEPRLREDIRLGQFFPPCRQPFDKCVRIMGNKVSKE